MATGGRPSWRPAGGQAGRQGTGSRSRSVGPGALPSCDYEGRGQADGGRATTPRRTSRASRGPRTTRPCDCVREGDGASVSVATSLALVFSWASFLGQNEELLLFFWAMTRAMVCPCFKMIPVVLRYCNLMN